MTKIGVKPAFIVLVIWSQVSLAKRAEVLKLSPSEHASLVAQACKNPASCNVEDIHFGVSESGEPAILARVRGTEQKPFLIGGLRASGMIQSLKIIDLDATPMGLERTARDRVLVELEQSGQGQSVVILSMFPPRKTGIVQTSAVPSTDCDSVAGVSTYFEMYQPLSILLEEQSNTCGKDDQSFVYRENPIPSVKLPDGFSQASWREIGLSTCAMTLDSNDKDTQFPGYYKETKVRLNGFVVHGKPRRAGPTVLRLVADGEFIYVETVDETPVRSGSPVLSDHLEFWVEYKTDSKNRESYAQWLISASGNVTKGSISDSSITPPTAETIAIGKNVIRYKISLPKNLSKASIVYSDSFSGKKQDLMISNVARKPNLKGSGPFSRIDSLPDVSCIISKGSLIVQPLPIGRSEPR